MSAWETITPSILNDSFGGQNIHVCRFSLYSTLNISHCFFLAFKVSAVKSNDILMWFPLYVTIFLLLFLKFSHFHYLPFLLLCVLTYIFLGSISWGISVPSKSGSLFFPHIQVVFNYYLSSFWPSTSLSSLLGTLWWECYCFFFF